MAATDEEKEIRAQRHDFIKEYYRMATLDLDRHLKGGWQTIAVLAGGVAILTAGHDGKLGLPIATTIALWAAIWGALTVIDANYWSLRAIGFLANVEAVYFAADDRQHFNPYMGIHPPFKLLNSLRYLFWLCILFGAASLVAMFWDVSRFFPTVGSIWAKVKSMGAIRFAIWGLPIITALWGGVWIFAVSRRRLLDYIEFSRGSPGPGVRMKVEELRHVTFHGVTGGIVPALERDTQATTQSQLEQERRHYDQVWRPVLVLSALATALYAAVILAKLVYHS